MLPHIQWIGFRVSVSAEDGGVLCLEDDDGVKMTNDEIGDLENLHFIKIGEKYIIDTCCNILEPVVLVASEQ